MKEREKERDGGGERERERVIRGREDERRKKSGRVQRS